MNQGALLTTPLLNIELVWTVLKWVYVFVSGLFVIFSLVVMAQIRQMAMSLKRQFNSVLIMVGVVYFGLTLVVLLTAISVL